MSLGSISKVNHGKFLTTSNVFFVGGDSSFGSDTARSNRAGFLMSSNPSKSCREFTGLVSGTSSSLLYVGEGTAYEITGELTSLISSITWNDEPTGFSTSVTSLTLVRGECNPLITVTTPAIPA